MRIEFIEEYPLSKLKPADYNPRFLSTDKFEKLKKSIDKFGIVKPVIINGDNNVLTAGHQRTKTMKELGIKTTPAIKIKGIKIQDEIRFNLFHNSIETSKSVVKITQQLELGYNIVAHENLLVGKNENPIVVKAIGDLILKYGEWGSIICDKNGLVLFNSDYALASKQLKHDVICYVVENKVANELINYLTDEYGEYNYEALQIKSYNQLYCQMTRLSDKSISRLNKSSTYENFVIPKLNKNIRILDFGAGKCGYVNMLKKQGYNIRAYEPFFQNNKNNIDIKTVIRMIKDIEIDVEQNGLYDIVVLDSVINSVVNSDFENYVLTTCNSLLKENGTFIMGTRNLDFIDKRSDTKRVTGNTRYLQFLDKENFTATFRSGVWTVQHFHNTKSLNKLLKKYFEKVNCYGKSNNSNIWAVCEKPIKLNINDYKTALNIEFNMEYPNNFKHNKHEKLLDLILSNIEMR